MGRTISLLICDTLIAIVMLHAQEPSSVAALFGQLQSPENSNEATEELLKVARSSTYARGYLAIHLPLLIEQGPKEPLQAWRNAVRLAADLKIVEAAPALGKWIGLNTGGSLSLGEEARLDRNPAAKALAQIGDPALPSLSSVLNRGNLGDRQMAVYALKLIGSPRARTVLREQLRREPDTNLRNLIERALAG